VIAVAVVYGTPHTYYYANLLPQRVDHGAPLDPPAQRAAIPVDRTPGTAGITIRF
jgi:hypothetical protein